MIAALCDDIKPIMVAYLMCTYQTAATRYSLRLIDCNLLLHKAY